MKLNIGSGTHYADGWTNVDVVSNDECHPDVVANVLEGLPYNDGEVDQIFLSHVLEHIPWDRTVEFMTEIRRVMSPGGRVMVVGPDVLLTIEGWREGKWERWLVESVMEHAAPFMDGGEGWEGARHSWNCYEKRAKDVVEFAGFTIGESYTGRLSALLPDWPLVVDTEWQFGFAAQL